MLEMRVIERFKQRESSVEGAFIQMYLAATVSTRRVVNATRVLWCTKIGSTNRLRPNDLQWHYRTTPERGSLITVRQATRCRSAATSCETPLTAGRPVGSVA